MHSNMKKTKSSYKTNHNRFSTRRYVKRFLVCVLVLIMLLCSILPSVNAASDATEKGFVEYQTQAPVDFSEIIEVILTDTETGYYYTHSLYKNNGYTANMAVPFGTYSISADVISETDEDVSEYSIIYSTDDIVVQNAHSAVAIPLRVEILAGVEVSDDDYSVDQDVGLEDEFPAEEETTESANEEVSSDKLEGKKDDYSLLYSTLMFLGILAVAGIVYLFVKWKQNHEK